MRTKWETSRTRTKTGTSDKDKVNGGDDKYANTKLRGQRHKQLKSRVRNRGRATRDDQKKINMKIGHEKQTNKTTAGYGNEARSRIKVERKGEGQHQ